MHNDSLYCIGDALVATVLEVHTVGSNQMLECLHILRNTDAGREH